VLLVAVHHRLFPVHPGLRKNIKRAPRRCGLSSAAAGWRCHPENSVSHEIAYPRMQLDRVSWQSLTKSVAIPRLKCFLSDFASRGLPVWRLITSRQICSCGIPNPAKSLTTFMLFKGRHESLSPDAARLAGASGSARQDRRRHREARNAVCSRRRTWRPISGNAWRAFTWTKPASSARSASAASSIWRRPLRLLGKYEVCRDRTCRQSKCQKVDESGFPDEGKNFPDRPI